MGEELREIMVYNSPPELGALWTEVDDMMKIMGKEQKVAVANEMRRAEVTARRRKIRKDKMVLQATIGVSIVISIFVVMFMFMNIINVRQERWPELGNCPMPKGTWLYKKWTSTVWASCE
jgi:hypothetical protein